jgi:membrane protease subunit (stomatin/prohibitin family)
MTLSEYLIEAVAKRVTGKYSVNIVDQVKFNKQLEQSSNGTQFRKLNDDIRNLIWSNLINQRYNNIGQAMSALIPDNSDKFYYFIDEDLTHIFTKGALYTMSYFNGSLVTVSKTPYVYNWAFLKKRYERHQLERIEGAKELVIEINRLVK